jgi:hypothetical protein
MRGDHAHIVPTELAKDGNPLGAGRDFLNIPPVPEITVELPEAGLTAYRVPGPGIRDGRSRPTSSPQPTAVRPPSEPVLYPARSVTDALPSVMD